MPSPQNSSGPYASRRAFLASVVATAVAAGCSSDGESATSSSAKGSSGSTTSQASSTTTMPAPDFDGSPFGLGIASGDPDPTSVVLWTKLMVDPLADDGGISDDIGDVDLIWECASDEAFEDIAASGVATSKAALGRSVHALADGLDSDRFYFYRFRVGDHVSPTGTTRTCPAPDDSPDHLKIVFASCQSYPNGFYTAHDHIAETNADFVFFLGDYIYEYPGDGVRTIDGDEAISLEDYRRLYSIYKSDLSLQAAHQSAPWIVTWDDHEVENNHSGLINTGGLSEEEFAERRAAAYQAYYENQPLRLEPPEGADWEIYRTVSFGSLAEFFVLDGRQYRDDQPCDTGSDTIIPKSECADLDEDRTMLGADQENWLVDGLAGSNATWKGIAQQTVMSSLVFGDIVLNVDQWDGYAEARQRLLASLVDNEVENVVVMTGDIHSGGAGILSTDDGIPVATEFVCTSITSGSLVDRFPGGADLVTPEIFEGIEYLNVRDHGFCVATITPESWSTEFVIVDSITEPTSESRVDATLAILSGSAEFFA